MKFVPALLSILLGLGESVSSSSSSSSSLRSSSQGVVRNLQTSGETSTIQGLAANTLGFNEFRIQFDLIVISALETSGNTGCGRSFQSQGYSSDDEVCTNSYSPEQLEPYDRCWYFEDTIQDFGNLDSDCDVNSAVSSILMALVDPNPSEIGLVTDLSVKNPEPIGSDVPSNELTLPPTTAPVPDPTPAPVDPTDTPTESVPDPTPAPVDPTDVPTESVPDPTPAPVDPTDAPTESVPDPTPAPVDPTDAPTESVPDPTPAPIDQTDAPSESVPDPTPAPVPDSTPPPTPDPSSAPSCPPCEDNPDFEFIYVNKKGVAKYKGGCDHVAKKPKKRCKKMMNGTKIKFECPFTCNACPC